VDGAVWARLVREALVLIGREYQLLLARGAPPAVKPVPASAKLVPSTAGTPSVTPSPLLKQNIFAPKAPPSPGARVGSALASGGAVEAVVAPLVAPAIERLPAVPDVKWRQHLRSALGDAVAAVPVPARVRALVDAVLGLALPPSWTQARAGRAAAGWVPRREVCVEAIGGTSRLSSHVFLSNL
jgi:nucleoporin NDC1